MRTELNRRTFVNAAATIAGAAAMAPLLTACGGGADRKTGTNTAKGLKAALPAYVPHTAVKPEIPSVAGGLWGTAPTAGNSFYQAMNKALGVELTMKPADGNNYATIVPTMTAAKKLPDWIQLPTWGDPNFNVGALAGSPLADLTPYLAGDKIKKYPDLAAIPTGAWQTGAWGDKLYGIPSFPCSFVISGTTFYCRDILEARGITAGQVKSADDLMSLGKELTDAKRGVWAFDDLWTYLYTAWGAPLKWRVDSGKVVHLFETQEFLEALDWHHRLAKSGYVHPDAIAGDNANAPTRFFSGKVLIQGGGTGVWNLADHQSGTAADKNYRRGAFDVIAADGTSKPVVHMAAATSIMSYINARLKPEQIEELLAVANYLAAPYGTAAYTMTNFGAEGVHHTRVDGIPSFTEDGKKYVQTQTFPFLAGPSAVLSNPGAENVTKDYAAWQAANATPGAINRAGGLVLWPDGLTTASYVQMLEDSTVLSALVVSLGITVVGTAVSMVVSILCAYGLSRPRSLGHRFILVLLIITMFVNGGLIPTFLVVTGLGGYGAWWALVLPSAVSVFNILVLRAFYSETSSELIDAARMDGAGDWRILWSIVLPTSRAVTAVIALFYGVGYWNSFFSVMLYMPTDSEKWPLQYVLLTYVNRGNGLPGSFNGGFGSTATQTAPLSLQMAVVVLTLVPLVLVYPFVQKHLRTGVLTGAITG